VTAMISRSPLSRSSGFTLLELLVAMAIFAIISALALGGLNAVVTEQTIAKAQMQRLAELQRALRYLTDDFAQLNPRFVRQVLGDATDPPLVTDNLGENVVRLSRSGWRNPVPVARGTLQRVQYRIEEDDLIREYWLVMDYPLGAEPRSEVVLEDVTEIEIEYLDADAQWSTQWPPLRQGLATTFPYPQAVRINLELADWGEIVRIVDLLE
jgi:general secretion pathway protein J